MITHKHTIATPSIKKQVSHDEGGREKEPSENLRDTRMSSIHGDINNFTLSIVVHTEELELLAIPFHVVVIGRRVNNVGFVPGSTGAKAQKDGKALTGSLVQ